MSLPIKNLATPSFFKARPAAQPSLRINSGVENIQNVQWIVFPPYIFLDRTAESLKDSSVKFGGQDLSDQVSGAYTGEISAGMLKDFGCSYVLIGHSERRIIHKENNELIKRKFKVALDANLILISFRH